MREFYFGMVRGLTALLITSGAAQAALIDRGGGLIYDDVLDITWTQNANINGLDTWAGQLAWADSLALVDAVRGVTWRDWRLPSVDRNGDDTVIDCSSATEVTCRDNEYGYLFHQYGVRSSAPGPFIDVQSSDYWSGTEFRPNPFGAWVFRFFGGGTQGGGDRNDDNHAWAVRDGDVAADTDGDGLLDVADNCRLLANPAQTDSDSDGIGNVCDADLDQSCSVNFLDLGIMESVFFGDDQNADLTGPSGAPDGAVNFLDLNRLKTFFFVNYSVSNPSGVPNVCNQQQ